MRHRYRREPQVPKKSSSRQYIVITLAAAFLGFLAQFQWVGSIAILAFTGYALWRALPSRLVFTLAMLSLGLVPVAVILNRWLIAQNFGAYSFLLFVAGLIILTKELRRATHSLRKINNAKQKTI